MKKFSKPSIFLVMITLVISLANAEEREIAAEKKGQQDREPRVVYPSKTRLQFEDLGIDGELRNPGDFYFQHRVEERFGSLIKRRENFHMQMLRDAVMTK